MGAMLGDDRSDYGAMPTYVAQASCRRAQATAELCVALGGPLLIVSTIGGDQRPIFANAAVI